MTRSLWGLCVAVLGALLACSSPQLDTGPAHPASAQAPAAPPTSVGSALEPNFEPQRAAPHSEHAHGPAAHEPAAEKKDSPAATQWTCPMHPEIIRNEPGNCPICGMKLKPIPPEAGVKGSP